MGGRERGKKGAGHSRLVGGSFTKQRELSYEACLERQQDERIPSAPLQFPKVYKEALTVLSLYTVQVFSTPCRHLKAVSMEQPPGAGKTSRTHIPRMGWGAARSLQGPGSSCRLIWKSCLFDGVPHIM